MNVNLSPRQKQTLEYLAQGLTLNDAAERMNVKARTLRYHVRVAQIKLDRPNMLSTVAAAVKLNLLDFELE